MLRRVGARQRRVGLVEEVGDVDDVGVQRRFEPCRDLAGGEHGGLDIRCVLGLDAAAGDDFDKPFRDVEHRVAALQRVGQDVVEIALFGKRRIEADLPRQRVDPAVEQADRAHDFLRRALDLTRQVLHRIGHDAETAAGLAEPLRFASTDALNAMSRVCSAILVMPSAAMQRMASGAAVTSFPWPASAALAAGVLSSSKPRTSADSRPIVEAF